MEHRIEDMFLVDFYIPEARLIFEINGNDHFYPYTYKKNNVTNLKSKILRQWGRSSPDVQDYTLINLNVQMLQGLCKEPDNLKSFLKKVI